MRSFEHPGERRIFVLTPQFGATMRFGCVAMCVSIALPIAGATSLVRGEPDSSDPDTRCATLEDFYGETGNQFRAALELYTHEPTPSTPSGFTGFGVAVDDMVVSWKETRLDEDSHTHCASGGECATLETASAVSFEGVSVVALTVTDKTPYDPVHNVNDCNGDGDYTDPTDDQDCNDNGIPDVTVKLTSSAEVAGEIAVLDRIAPGSPVYKASFPYSTLYDSPGTLFVQQVGTAVPQIVARYEDRNDGTGSRCKNALDPSQEGFIIATTDIYITSGRISVQTYKVNNVSLCSLTVGTTDKPCVTNADCGVGEGLCNSCSLLPAKPCDPAATSGSQYCAPATQGVCTSTAGRGDPDGFADTNETIDFAVQFANKSGVDVDDLTATLGTNSPYIECISRSFPFAVIEGPVEFRLGSPPTETERFAGQEPYKRMAIPRRFAIAAKEVSVEQFQRFLKLAKITIDRYQVPPGVLNKFSPDPEGPWIAPDWYTAAHYCNWLSEQAGLPKDERCYIPNEAGAYAEGMSIPADVLQRRGYRLPTEAEWEYACRSGAVTSRYYGNSIALLDAYARYQANSKDRAWACGSLLPNDLGLFDMLGNVYEWCQDAEIASRLWNKGIFNDRITRSEFINEKTPRIFRGGSFNYVPAVVRSADRVRLAPASRYNLGGFRPSRTYP